LWEEIGPESVVGCVVYSANEVLEDGTILNRGKNRYVLGEPRHAKTPRLNALAGLFTSAKIPVHTSEDIHLEIWRKLLANASGNPISALTRLSTTPRGADPLVSDLMARLRQEVIDIGLALGLALTDDDKKLSVSAGDVRPSMLQDAVLQRPMEVDAILGQAQVFAREKNIATPVLDIVHSLLHGLDLANRIARESAE
jgi:2-dehydropantoate 2-reductase